MVASPACFMNAEFVLPFAQVSHVLKHPPDRLEIAMNNGTILSVLGEDCRNFLKAYMAFLDVPQPQPKVPATAA